MRGQVIVPESEMRRPGGFMTAVLVTVAAIALAWILVLSRDPCRVFAVAAALCFTALAGRLLLSHANAAAERAAVNLRNPRAGLLAALAAGAVAYAWTVPSYFICDDFQHLDWARQPFSVAVWGQLTHGQFGGQAGAHFPMFFRPLGFFSLFLEYHIWHGWAPGYHLVSILLHLLSIAALFFFCEALGLSSVASGSAALFFALLPVNVQAVTWTGCRFDQLATCLMLWATTFYIRFRRSGRITFCLLALAFFVLAALSKESAYALPFIWLALEFVVLERPDFKAIMGFVGSAGACFLWRLAVLGGIGGYHYGRQRPMESAINSKAALAVLFRQPSETLLGYNWVGPHGAFLLIIAGLNVALILALILLVRITNRSKRLLGFAAIWLIAAGVPTHPLFWWQYDSGLSFSRELYLGSAGLALLLAVLLEWTCDRRAAHFACIALLGCIFAAGLAHNLRSWLRAATLSHNFVTELRRIVPVPPQHTTFYIARVPIWFEGVPFFVVGLSSAVRGTYGYREDITVIQVDQLPRAVDQDGIKLDWTGNVERPVVLVR
jgi:hypothetical protein